MDSNEVKGLIGSVGKAIALSSDRDENLRALESVRSRDEFRDFLESRDLGISEPSRSRFIDALTQSDEWEDHRSRLAASADVSYHEFMSPGA